MVDISFSLIGFEYFLLVFMRIASFLVAAPVFNSTAIPQRTKVGLAFFTSVIVYGVVEKPEYAYQSAIGYAILVIGEVITGLLIGFAANICNSIVLFAGTIIDMDIGISMATEFNQEMGTDASLTGNFYYYMVMLLLLATDMHTYVLRAICDSFELIPPGGVSPRWDSLMLTMTKYMGDSFVIAFRIFLPFFACIMILNCVLGVMSKVAPQMNMFSVGIQMKLLLGFVVIFLVIYLFPQIAQFIFDEMKTMIVQVIGGLHG